MTYEEMEKSLQEVGRLIDRDGREWRERMGRLENSVQELRDAQLAQVRSMDRHEQAASDRMERIEKSLQELRDAQLVQVHLLDRREREWHERFENHEDGIAALRELVRSHEDGIAELRGAMAQLFHRMDRFIQGLERENGHK